MLAQIRTQIGRRLFGKGRTGARQRAAGQMAGGTGAAMRFGPALLARPGKAPQSAWRASFDVGDPSTNVVFSRVPSSFFFLGGFRVPCKHLSKVLGSSTVGNASVSNAQSNCDPSRRLFSESKCQKKGQSRDVGLLRWFYFASMVSQCISAGSL